MADLFILMLIMNGIPSSKRTWAKARWFKDSKKFYVVRNDNRKVKDLWVIDVLANRPNRRISFTLCMGIRMCQQLELCVFVQEDRKPVKINTDKWPDQTLRVLQAG